MTLSLSPEIKQRIEELRRLGDKRGFTLAYQAEQENNPNQICHKRRAPVTDERYDRAVLNWKLWMLSRNEPEDKYFTELEPDPPNQILKLFSESFITLREGELPSQSTVRQHLSCFLAEWERQTNRKLPDEVRNDVYNHINVELTPKYGLETKHREKFPVTKKDLDILLRHLFETDDHDYLHECSRFQDAFALCLFSNSGSRAGSIVESSSYRGTNECLYYRHLVFNLRWNSDMKIKYWITIDPEFLKGHRYDDEANIPKNWIPEQEILGRNFVFYVIVSGITDTAFKGIQTVDELLEKTPPKGRESWTLQWREEVLNLPVIRMVHSDGPDDTAGKTFSSIRHDFTSLSQRACFRNVLRIHGIRGGVANAVDPKASEATRSQALDHQNPDTFLKYQSKYKRVDIQSCFWNLEPDYECLETEESMSHHRDPNVPQQLDAAALSKVEDMKEMKDIYHNVAELTRNIAKAPHEHQDLVCERARLYTKAAKIRRAKRAEFIKDWWESCYNVYIAGNEFEDRDSTNLLDIYCKYLPERERLRSHLFTKASLHSEIGRQCLHDMVNICRSREKVAYYPSEKPIDGKCPVCSKEMASFHKQERSKHILQCRRKSLNTAPYQQVYRNGKRAHRRVHRNFLEWCYLCAEWFHTEEGWAEHCRFHLSHLQPRCGLLTFRCTFVYPGLCPFCLGDGTQEPQERFKQWRTKSTLINHINIKHLGGRNKDEIIHCPHPCCENKPCSGTLGLRRHFFNAHSIEEPRRNCVSQKRNWIGDSDVEENPHKKKPQIVD